MLEQDIVAFDAIYQTNSALRPSCYFQVMTEAMNRLREHDPRVRAIFEEVQNAGTDHRHRHNVNKDMNLAVLERHGIIDSRTYSKIKNGKRKPTHGTIAATCFILGLNCKTMEEWFRFAGDVRPDDHLCDLYEYFLSLPLYGEKRTIAYCKQLMEHYGYGDEHRFGV